MDSDGEDNPNKLDKMIDLAAKNKILLLHLVEKKEMKI